MSYGDEIMACGQALSLARKSGKRVKILDRDGSHRWNDLWRNIPQIIHPKESVSDFATITNGIGARPYLDYSRKTERRAAHTNWQARDNIGEIIFDQDEIDFALAKTRCFHRFVVIEPTIAQASGLVRWSSNPNKQWGRDRWQKLVRLIDLPVIQVGPDGTDILNGVYFIKTNTFRLGAAILQRAVTAVLPEGGLHHAAGALRLKVIVLFGGTISPLTTGYTQHINISRGDPCLSITPCEHCSKIWSEITPNEVAGHVRSIL